MPDAGDFDDVLTRAGRKRRTKLHRLAVASTVPLAAAAVVFALRPVVPSGGRGLGIATDPTERRSAGPDRTEQAVPSALVVAPGAPAAAPTRSHASGGQPTGSPAARPLAPEPRETTERPPAKGPGTVPKNRVEAESGEMVDRDCGDKPETEPMEVRENSDASGGYEVFHPGTGCAMLFPDQAGRTVSAIVFSFSGRDRSACGHFRITGGQVGVSSRICGMPSGWHNAKVSATYVGGDQYRIEWVPDEPADWYINAQVDYHELGPASPLPG